MMPGHPLEPEQEELLLLLTRAWRTRREEFHAQAGDNQLRLYHRGLPQNGFPINGFDVDALAAAGYLRITKRGRRGDLSFALTQAGLDWAERRTEGSPSAAEDRMTSELSARAQPTPMDYVAWCGVVLATLLEAQEAEPPGTFSGLWLDDLPQRIFGQTGGLDGRSPHGRAVLAAYHDLSALGLLEASADNALMIPRQQREVARDQTALWRSICSRALDPNEERLLRALNQRSERRGADHAYVEAVQYEHLAEDLGLEAKSAPLDYIDALITDLETQGLARASPALSDFSATATYAGLAWDHRRWVLDQDRPAFSTRSMSVDPVWNGRDFELDEQLCFVLMPFEPTLTEIYQDHVKPTVEGAGLHCIRADDIYSTQPIMEDIWEQLCRARVVVAELTGRNPNVFYEIGIAHTLGKSVILLTQRMDDVPFDL